MSPAYTSPPDRARFYEQVWDIVRKIPPGKVATYGQIASLILAPAGMDPKEYMAWGARWVGGAMAACPQDVPWQRVINSQGKVSLAEGSGGAKQRTLLEEEGVQFDERDRVDLKKYQWNSPFEE